MTWTSAVIAFGPFFTIAVLILLVILGLILSPIAAFITYLVVRRQVPNPMLYALVGALCSTLFILPWLSLILAWRNYYLPMYTTLVSVYAAWLAGPFGMLYLAFAIADDSWVSIEFIAGSGIAMALVLVATLIWTVKVGVRHDSQLSLKPAYIVIVPSVGLFLSNMTIFVWIFFR